MVMSITWTNENSVLDPAIGWRYMVVLPTFKVNKNGLTYINNNSASNNASYANQPVDSNGVAIITVGKTPNIAANYLQVERFTMPQTFVETAQEYVAGSVLHYPRNRLIEPLVITFFEDSKFSIMQYIYTWRSLVIDVNGNYGMPATYKQQITVQLFDQAGNVQLEMDYLGCYPTRPSEWDIDGGASNLLKSSVVFSVDSVKIANWNLPLN